MDLNNFLSEIETSVELENKFINCYTKFKNNYLQYKKSLKDSILKDLEFNSKDIISNLELMTAYIAKHNEVKTIYKSYKSLLKELLEYRNKMKILTMMSKPLITDDKLEILLDEQLRIQKLVNKINEAFNKNNVGVPKF